MKKILCLVSVTSLLIFSCKKDSTFNNPPMASITIVNAVLNGDDVRMGSNDRVIPNFGYWPLTIPGNYSDLYIWPITDSLNSYYNQTKFQIENRANYTMFLGGFPTSVDAILLKDNLPYHTDSTCGIRFINLCPNCGAINITLPTSPTLNEASDLNYKQYSDFKIYPALATNVSYTFEVRKASNDSLLTTYSLWSTPIFANETLVIRGLIDGNPDLGVTEVRY